MLLLRETQGTMRRRVATVKARCWVCRYEKESLPKSRESRIVLCVMFYWQGLCINLPFPVV